MSTHASRPICRYSSIEIRDIDRCARSIKLVAFVLIVVSPFWLWALFFTSPREYSYTSSLICVPLLAIVSSVAILHFTQTDAYLRRLMMTGLVAHMAASSLFLWIGIAIYGGADDAFHYWTVGRGLADQFQTSGWSVFRPPYWSTNLIFNICGVAALLIGDALPTLCIAFAFVPLVGSYLFYRAFIAVFPNGDRWLFGLMAVLWPSVLFWASFIGKDSLIQCFIAMTCLGFAKLTMQHSLRGALVFAAGIAGILLIRAHVAAIMAIAMTVPYLVGRPRTGNIRRSRKVILVPVLLGATYFLITQARTFLYSNTSGGNVGVSVFQEADLVTKNSQIGGSSFNKGTSLAVRIAESPFLLFRPFPWEIHNWLALASAVESYGLILFCIARRREIWSTFQRWRDPYVGFLLMYAIVFSITFGATISNFGLLARERIMMMPPVFMFICAQPKLVTQGSSKRVKEGPRLIRFSSRIAVAPRSTRA